MFDRDAAVGDLAAFQALLDETPARAAHVRVAPDAWTLAEIVGHLVDSASNNHQRFARLRLGDLAGFPGYDAEPWVAAQDYDACDFALLAGLWTHYNALVLHLASTAPDRALGNVWETPDGGLTLEFLMTDYYAHLRLHTEHYARRLAEVEEARG